MTNARRPRVLVLSFNWPPTGYAFDTLEGVAEQGIDLCVGVALRPGQQLPRHDTIELFEMAARKGSPLSRMQSSVRSGFGARRRHGKPLAATLNIREGGIRRPTEILRSLNAAFPLLGRDPDVVHHEWANDPADHPWLRTVLGVPSVISCRGLQTTVDPYDPRKPRYLVELGTALAKAHRVHCVSDFMASEAESLGARPDSIRVIRPAVDLSTFTQRPPRRPGTPARLLCVANLRWVKGLEHLLLAVRELRRRERSVVLDVVGDGRLERERLEAAIADLGLADCVNLRGRTDRRGVVDALQRADIVVQPSLSEGLANSTVEAMAVGVPVVVSDVGGLPELVDDQASGLRVPPRDPRGLADAVERLLDDDPLRNRLVRAARDRVTSAFRLDDQVSAWVDLYRELASHTSSSPATASTRVQPAADSATGRTLIKDERATGPLIVAVGPFGWRGGHDLVLEAAALLAASGVRFRLVVAGWGGETGEVGFLRHDLGLEQHTEIRCDPDQAALDRLARQADLLIHLPRVLGVGGTRVASLLRQGPPVVTTETTVVAPTDSQIRAVPRRDPDASAKAISGLLGLVGGAVPSTRAP